MKFTLLFFMREPSDDGTYTALLQDSNGAKWTLENCSFQEVRFGHDGLNIEVNLETVGLRTANGYEPVRDIQKDIQERQKGHNENLSRHRH